MASLTSLNCWMAEKIQRFFAWLETKTKLKCELLERFNAFYFVLIIMVMLVKTKYYNTNYLLIEKLFSDFNSKVLFFMMIIWTFLFFIFPQNRQKMEEERAKRSPMLYQIAIISRCFICSILGLLLIPTAIITKNYLQALLIINIMIYNFFDYNYYPTAHYK